MAAAALANGLISELADRGDDLLFAVPKKGRLYEHCIKVRARPRRSCRPLASLDTTWKGSGPHGVCCWGRLQILEVAGFKFARQNRLDLAPCANLPITLVFLPAADIPKYVAEGNIDMGITGSGTRGGRRALVPTAVD